MTPMTEEEVTSLFDDLSNQGRWGPEDELGTLNFITAETRIAASTLVRTGVVISLARDLSDQPSGKNPLPVVHRMLFTAREPIGAVDQLEIAPHGWETTHLDAVGHMFLDGRMYNGRRAAQEVSAAGLSFGSIYAMRGGIVGRGVLLDVPKALGLPYLPPTFGIGVEELVAAERLAKTTVGSGDIVIVRSGLTKREAVEGEASLDELAGLEAECLPWLHEREVAVYGGDCDDKVPSRYGGIRFPIHQLGLAAMGLCLVDNVSVEELSEHCATEGTYEFLFMTAPLRSTRATGSAVNPLAVF